MNPSTNSIETMAELNKLADDLTGRTKSSNENQGVGNSKSGSAPYLDIFILPEVGKRVASFAGYHWKIKSVNKETNEVVLEPDAKTSQGEKVFADMKNRPEAYR